MCHSTFQEKLGSLGRLYNPHLQPQDDRVRFTSVSNCGPFAEHEFPYAIKDNYYSLKKLNFGLNQDQVDKLMTLFHSKKISKNPERNVWRRGDKPKEGHARSGGDLKKVIVDRLRVMSKEDEHINLNEEKIVEVDKVSSGRKRDMFKKTHLRENDDFGDSGSWKKLPGDHIDHSLVGLKREADVGSHYMVDESNGHEFNNHREIRGLTNKDNFSVQGIIIVPDAGCSNLHGNASLRQSTIRGENDR